MPEPGPVLIVAISGRALAVSARRGGYAPRVADCFGDRDTIAAVERHVSLRSGLSGGFEADEVMAALEALADGSEPAGVVCGTGFESRPDILALIAGRWRLLGNDADTVARLKDPLALAALCASCGIAHPETSLEAPAVPDGWLAKRRGGAGGSHVGDAVPCTGDTAVRYYQRRVEGSPVSALVIADGVKAVVMGLSAQWASPAPGKAYRYGGAVRPAALPAATAAALRAAAARFGGEAGLVGLNSVDFLVCESGYFLLEVNPRPGATIDIFEPPAGSLFALHVEACRGRMPAGVPKLGAAAATAIVYAERDIARLPRRRWPKWSADRPDENATFRTGEPLCTVRARARTAARARALVAERLSTILAWTHGPT